MFYRQFIPFILVALLIFQTSCNSSKKTESDKNVQLSEEIENQVNQKMMEYINGGKLAGISTLVFENDEIIHRKNLGFANFKDSIPISDNTIYRIYSMTKPITAAALMTLFDQGKFELDDKVSKQSIIENRIKVYNSETAPVQNYYDAQQKYNAVQGMGTIDDIFERISTVIEKLK